MCCNGLAPFSRREAHPAGLLAPNAIVALEEERGMGLGAGSAAEEWTPAVENAAIP